MTGIDTVITDDEHPRATREIFTLDGKRIAAPQRTANLVLYFDDTPRKTVVK